MQRLELACILWFSLEYILRLVSSPNKWTFLKGRLNAIDLISVLTYVVAASLMHADKMALQNYGKIRHLAFILNVRALTVGKGKSCAVMNRHTTDLGLVCLR